MSWQAGGVEQLLQTAAAHAQVGDLDAALQLAQQVRASLPKLTSLIQRRPHRLSQPSLLLFDLRNPMP